MATPIPLNGILRVTIGCYYGLAKQLGESRLYYQLTAGTMDLEDAAPFFYGRFRTPYKAWLDSSCSYVGVSVQKVAPTPRSGTIYKVQEEAGTGSVLGAAPSQTSGLIRFATEGADAIPPALAVPGTKGRAYIPFLALENFSGPNNSLSDDGVTKLRAISSRMGPFYSSGSVTFKLGVYNENTRQFRPAVSMEESYYVATQRRRGAFGQLNKPFGG